MHCAALRTFFFSVTLSAVFTAALFAQTKSSGEVDVAKCWSYPLGEAAASGIAANGSRLFLALSGAGVQGLSLDGKKVWATELGGEIGSNILPVESSLLLVTSTLATDGTKPGESVLRSLSNETGITNWTQRLPHAILHFLARFNDSVIVVSKTGVIQSFDAKTGLPRWKREIADGFSGEPAFNATKVYVAATGKQIFGVLMGSGEIDSMRKLPFSVTALGETSTGGLVAGDERGNITSLNGTNRPNWKFKSGGEISAIVASGESVLVTSHDNFIYLILNRNGDVAWKKRMPGRIAHLAGLMDKYALISSVDEHGAILTDLVTGKVAGQISLGPEEILVSDPIASEGRIFILTNEAAYAFSLNGCT